MNHRLWRATILLVLISLLVACGGTTATTAPTAATQAEPTATTVAAVEPTAAPAPTEAPAATEAPTATEAPAATKAPTTTDASPYEFLARAEAGEFKGTTVSIFGVWVEEDEKAFNAALKAFQDRTGITIQYEGSNEFETLISVRVEGNTPPDIAAFPQPGLMKRFAETDKLVEIGSFTNVDQLKEDYIQSWIDLASYEDKLYGVFYRASTKSLVWYPVPEFEEAGYKIPETWDDMLALSEQMVADGNTPWCVSIEHGGVTGWVATDWMEDIMLRTAGPDVYDQWVNHEIPFNDPSVKAAAEKMGEIWFNEKYVYGGRTAILTVPVAETQNPMFDDKPSCWLHRQAGWIPGFFPKGIEAGKDSNFFYLPPIDPAQGKPVLGAGDLFSMFNDRPEVRAVIEYLATPDAAKGWIEQGGFISANKNIPLDWYPNEVDRRQAEILQQATVFRFDASDLMPAEVGTGTFWSGMVDYVNGEEIDTVLQSIEDSWPE